MNRAAFAMAFLSAALTGCMANGPREHYRAAVQAKSEYVDSLSLVVDEPSAAEHLRVARKQCQTRYKDIHEAIKNARLDDQFHKLRRQNFNIKNLDVDYRDRMIEGVKAYAEFCQNIVYTNARQRRELQRLQMVANLELLAKARTQIASNQPVNVSMAADCPKLDELIKTIGAVNWSELWFVPKSVGKDDIDKLQATIEPEHLRLMLTFNPDDLNVAAPGLELPPLPRYPEWAIDVDRRAKLGLTGS